MSTNDKLFLVDAAYFSVAYNIDASTIHSNNNLSKILNWAFQCKLSLPQIKKDKSSYHLFQQELKNSPKQVSFQKHLGTILDTKLNLQ